ncbi:probable E3 ubiquitin-protein ligase RHA4A [Punica granatum]|uniref:RING-type E3 ubiquitin transferase n=2 Tax=Punica granatum TaxID=22663 RepID=A0A218WI01_PUNGR|nr:probable E3 ubiquitin-protein ligase RHA4A [Punica granatum]OWM72138.1 hypothetical protein CDL15_Pgr018021 [Punica granatum]PKI66277.1 hypothetical protein CRG98_013358 [Punica granatum]
MGSLPETPSSAHLYPQALQVKLYQAFIFSIPILFSIILFLLFYLFYLKRRAISNPSVSSQPVIARISRRATPYLPSPCLMGLKGELKDKLPIVLFDEELGRRDSQCCVCLGEFELKEELLQVPSCKHVFHVDCIHHWLHSNSTCPLCRCSISPAATVPCIQPPPLPPQQMVAEQPDPMPEPSSSSETTSNVINDCSRDHSVVLHVREEGS